MGTIATTSLVTLSRLFTEYQDEFIKVVAIIPQNPNVSVQIENIITTIGPLMRLLLDQHKSPLNIIKGIIINIIAARTKKRKASTIVKSVKLSKEF